MSSAEKHLPNEGADFKGVVRDLLKIYHPDQRSETKDPEYAEVIARILVLAMKSAKDPRRWIEEEMRGSFRVGQMITLKKGVSVPLPRSPARFIDILNAFEKTGEVPAELLEKEPKTFRGERKKPRWQVEEDETAEALKKRALEVNTLEELFGVTQAASLYPKSTMQALGVFDAVDENAARIALGQLARISKVADASTLSEALRAFPISNAEKRSSLLAEVDTKTLELVTDAARTLKQGDSLQELRVAAEAFPFSSGAVAAQAMHVIEERMSTLTSDVPEEVKATWRPSSLERRLVLAESLISCAAVVHDINHQQAESDAGRQRSLARIADSRAYALALDALNRAPSIERVIDVFEQVQAYPFYKIERGFAALDVIENRANGIFATLVASALSLEDLQEVRNKAERFPFRSGESRARLAGHLAEAEVLLKAKQAGDKRET